MALGFGIWAAVRGFQRHHQAKPLFVFIVGIGLLIGSHLVLPSKPDGSPSSLAELLSVIGGVSLIAFHALNKQALGRCR